MFCSVRYPHGFLVQDTAWLDLLWEAACTVTIQVRFCPTTESWMLTRNRASEKLKVLSSNVLSDTFLGFCYLVQTLQIDKEQQGKDSGLRFNNAPYNGSMHKACQALLPLLRSDAASALSKFEKAMTSLELKWGRDVLSNQYSKLLKMTILAKNAVTTTRLLDECCAFLINMLHLALNTRLVTPAKATETWLDRDRKHQKNGFWPACIALVEACFDDACTSYFDVSNCCAVWLWIAVNMS